MRRAAGALLAMVVLAGAAPAAAAPVPDPLIVGNVPVTAEPIRVAGADRYATAVAVSQRFNPPGEDTVVVATGADYADALAGGTLAARTGSPILLVTRDAVPGVTIDELGRLRPRRIVVLGGTAAVSDAVVAVLRGAAPVVERIAGLDRFGTAAAIAGQFPAGVARAYVANAFSPAEALVASAAAANAGAPLLLVHGGAVPAPTSVALGALRPGEVFVVGEAALVSDAVLAHVDALVAGPAHRLGGPGPAATAAVVMTEWFRFAPVDEILLATRAQFPDALAAGPLAVEARAPLLLARTNCVEDPVRRQLERLRPKRILLVGGTAALAPGVERRSCETGDPNVTYEFGGGVTPFQRALIQGGVEGVRRWVGGFLTPLHVQAFDDLDDLVAAQARYYDEDPAVVLDQWLDDTPVQPTGRGWMGWNGMRVDRFDTTYSVLFMATPVHEAFHHVQFEHIGDNAHVVATWLVEGGATWAEYVVARLEEWAPVTSIDEYEAAAYAAARASTPLRENEVFQEDDLSAYRSGFGGVAYIVERVGLDGYLSIFERVGAGETWQEALTGVMGVSLDRFYADQAAWLAAHP